MMQPHCKTAIDCIFIHEYQLVAMHSDMISFLVRRRRPSKLFCASGEQCNATPSLPSPWDLDINRIHQIAGTRGPHRWRYIDESLGLPIPVVSELSIRSDFAVCIGMIAYNCNGHFLLIFEEKFPNYASGPKSVPKSNSVCMHAPKMRQFYLFTYPPR